MDYEGKFKKLKEDYDGLLEKSQNDLVKIRLREKSLNVSLVRFRILWLN